MVNYNNSKIYTIRCETFPHLIFVGASTLPLYDVMTRYKRQYKKYLKGYACYNPIFSIIKTGTAYVELHEDYPCSSKEQLNKRLYQTIRNTNCINKMIKKYQILSKNNRFGRKEEFKELSNVKEVQPNILDKGDLFFCTFPYENQRRIVKAIVTDKVESRIIYHTTTTDKSGFIILNDNAIRCYKKV